MTSNAPRGDREQPMLPPLADQWHQHAFSPHVERPKSCIVCGRKQLWRHHWTALLAAGIAAGLTR